MSRSNTANEMLADFAKRIRSEREKRFLTQTQMAAQLGVSFRTYQEWEAGRAFPQIRHRQKVAQLLEEAAA